jgi:hypothetical protein
VGQINPVFATLIFQGHVWNTVGQRDSGTKIGVRQSGVLAYDITIDQAFFKRSMMRSGAVDGLESGGPSG